MCVCVCACVRVCVRACVCVRPHAGACVEFKTMFDSVFSSVLPASGYLMFVGSLVHTQEEEHKDEDDEEEERRRRCVV